MAIALTAYALTGGDPLALKLRRGAVTGTIGIAMLASVAIDGASQIALALTVSTGMFVPDSTAARIVVLGTGLVVTIWYLRYQKAHRDGSRPPARFERGS